MINQMEGISRVCMSLSVRVHDIEELLLPRKISLYCGRKILPCVLVVVDG